MKNSFYFIDDYMVLISKNGEKIKIDCFDFEKVKKHSWCVSKTGYAVANVNGKTKKMHRFLIGETEFGKVIDHINRNPLDNRRKNLRVCTYQENCRNCSNTKGRALPLGISKTQNGKKYRVRIMVDRKEICLGRYEKLEDALLARYLGEQKYFCGFRYNKK